MGFDVKAFHREKFRHRTKDVLVPELAQWFGGGEQPVWTVRSIDAAELSRVKNAPNSDRAILDLAETLASATGGATQDALKKLLSLDGKEQPEDYIKKLELLIVGSVDPVCDRDLAKKIAAVFPIVFTRLTDAILALAGLGQVPGKQPGSGDSQESATH